MRIILKTSTVAIILAVIVIVLLVIVVFNMGFDMGSSPSEMQQFCTWLGETKAGSTYEGCMAGDYSNSDYEMWVGFTG